MQQSPAYYAGNCLMWHVDSSLFVTSVTRRQ